MQSVVGARRGTPDIAMSAALDGGVIVYTSYDTDDVGWGIVGGTSGRAASAVGRKGLIVPTGLGASLGNGVII